VIVLTPAAGDKKTALVTAIVTGAENVRFMEVDVCEVGVRSTSRDHVGGQQTDVDELLDYDAVVFTSGGPGADNPLVELLRSAERHRPADGFSNIVFAVAGASDGALLSLVANLGGIIVSPPRGIPDPEAHARALGHRVATVAEWVRHARSHEHGQAHTHSHHRH
jgi:hypothetical protein